MKFLAVLLSVCVIVMPALGAAQYDRVTAPASAFKPTASVYINDADPTAGDRRIIITAAPGSTIWIQSSGDYEIKDGGNGLAHFTAVTLGILCVFQFAWGILELKAHGVI